MKKTIDHKEKENEFETKNMATNSIIRNYENSRTCDCKLSKTLNYLRSVNKLYDVCILVDKYQFYCHKLLIITHCPPFRLHILNTRPKDLVEIKLCYSTKRGMSLILSYIYSMEINIDIHNFADTLITSYELGIEKLIEKCEKYIDQNFGSSLGNNEAKNEIEISKIIVSLSILYPLKEKEFYKEIMNNIAKKFSFVLENDEFLNIDVKILYNLLKYYQITINKEIDLFIGILKWIKKDPSTRCKYLKLLFDFVKFQHISPLSIAKYIETEELVMNDPKILEKIKQSLKLHALQASKSNWANNIELEEPRNYKQPKYDDKYANAFNNNNSSNQKKSSIKESIKYFKIKNTTNSKNYIMEEGFQDTPKNKMHIRDRKKFSQSNKPIKTFSEYDASNEIVSKRESLKKESQRILNTNEEVDYKHIEPEKHHKLKSSNINSNRFLKPLLTIGDNHKKESECKLQNSLIYECNSTLAQNESLDVINTGIVIPQSRIKFFVSHSDTNNNLHSFYDKKFRKKDADETLCQEKKDISKSLTSVTCIDSIKNSNNTDKQLSEINDLTCITSKITKPSLNFDESREVSYCELNTAKIKFSLSSDNPHNIDANNSKNKLELENYDSPIINQNDCDSKYVTESLQEDHNDYDNLKNEIPSSVENYNTDYILNEKNSFFRDEFNQNDAQTCFEVKSMNSQTSSNNTVDLNDNIIKKDCDSKSDQANGAINGTVLENFNVLRIENEIKFDNSYREHILNKNINKHESFNKNINSSKEAWDSYNSTYAANESHSKDDTNVAVSIDNFFTNENEFEIVQSNSGNIDKHNENRNLSLPTILTEDDCQLFSKCSLVSLKNTKPNSFKDFANCIENSTVDDSRNIFKYGVLECFNKKNTSLEILNNSKKLETHYSPVDVGMKTTVSVLDDASNENIIDISVLFSNNAAKSTVKTLKNIFETDSYNILNSVENKQFHMTCESEETKLNGNINRVKKDSIKLKSEFKKFESNCQETSIALRKEKYDKFQNKYLALDETPSVYNFLNQVEDDLQERKDLMDLEIDKMFENDYTYSQCVSEAIIFFEKNPESVKTKSVKQDNDSEYKTVDLSGQNGSFSFDSFNNKKNNCVLSSEKLKNFEININSKKKFRLSNFFRICKNNKKNCNKDF